MYFSHCADSRSPEWVGSMRPAGMRRIPVCDRIPQTRRKLHALECRCAPIDAAGHSKKIEAANLHRLATGVGRSIRSIDAKQATKGNDEAETVAFNPFRDVSPRARLHSAFPCLAGRLLSTF